MGIHSINNHNIPASFFLQKLFGSFTLLHTYLSKIMSDCALYYDPTAECDSQDYTIFSAVACVLVISDCGMLYDY